MMYVLLYYQEFEFYKFITLTSIVFILNNFIIIFNNISHLVNLVAD